MTRFLKKLGLTPEIILKEIKGSFKLGIKFKGFLNGTDSYNHHFSNPYEDFDIIMNSDKVPEDLLENNDIAMHFNVKNLMEYIDRIIVCYSNLTILRLSVTDINNIKDDIIIDCTGFKKELTTDRQFKSIADKIPNNKALVYRAPYYNIEDRKPYTTATAMTYGWIWEIPLMDQLSTGYVHDSKYDIKNEYIEFLKQKFGTVQIENIIEIPMITGRNEKHIVEDDKIVITLGLSSFFIEPLESTGLYFVTYGIELMNEYIKGNITAEDYNTIYNREFDVVLDFIIAHYKYSNHDNEYWNKYKHIDIEQYKENNIFNKYSWQAVLHGLGQIDYQLIRTDAKRRIDIHKMKSYNEFLKEIE